VSAKPAILALEDGRFFSGEAFGAVGTVTGEICFNTSMTGYQEILTDPSYRGQIVTMTYPQIGNYGVNFLDEESATPHVRGFVIAELSPIVSNWRSQQSLEEYLEKRGIPGLQGIDTRALTKHLRTAGAMRACLSSEGISLEEAFRRARESSGVTGMDFVREVTPENSYSWDPGEKESRAWTLKPGPAIDSQKTEESETGDHFFPLSKTRHRIVAIDFGIKRNILRLLRRHGFEVTVVPAISTAKEILALSPEGVFLSNGPGDPAALDYAHQTVRDLIGRVPLFGICLGHQLIACALGGKTFKLKFGHRGANHPIKDLQTGSITITSQNHGFAVDADSLPEEVEITHWNLNDQTVAGLRHKIHPVFSVQYHPEASPGPHDSEYFFAEFAKVVEQSKSAC